MSVSCYIQSKSITTYRNLCEFCEALRRADGWDSKRHIPYIDRPCDDGHFFDRPCGVIDRGVPK